MSFWTDKHVLITGASSGMGLAAAELAASAGAHVSLIARDAIRLEASQEAVRSRATRAEQRISTIPCDVAVRAQVERAVEEASSASGPVDVLLTCAGFCEPQRFVETEIDDLVRHVEVNLLGTIYAARAVAPSMVERGSGHIGLVSSMGGLVGVYGYAGYSAAKFGVTGFAEVLRSELKPHGVGVTLACPPNMDTPGYAREIATEPRETAAINGIAVTIPPSVAAAKFLHAIERGRFLVLHGATNRLLYRVEGIWPELFHRVFDAKVAAARREGVHADALH
ncbi:MAG: SDR family oxidoreductase [Coriobacteriia bacterium]|nr:SDR family oxidoreductase [Coriobacteriia bacterium]